jgi:hypothetical protein
MEMKKGGVKDIRRRKRCAPIGRLWKDLEFVSTVVLCETVRERRKIHCTVFFFMFIPKLPFLGDWVKIFMGYDHVRVGVLYFYVTPN